MEEKKKPLKDNKPRTYALDFGDNIDDYNFTEEDKCSKDAQKNPIYQWYDHKNRPCW